MGWLGPVAQIGGALLGGIANNHAANAAQRGAQAGLDFTKGVYHDAQGNMAPYMAAGVGGLNGLSALSHGDYSGFMNSPDYLYAREQAQYGLDHSAAARGQLYDPGTQIELARQLNGIASGNLGTYRNSLQYLSSLGDQAAGQLGSIGVGQSGNVQAGYNGIANAQGQAAGGWAGVGTGLLGILGNHYGQQDAAQTLTQSSYGPYAGGYQWGGNTPATPPALPYSDGTASWLKGVGGI